MAHAAMKRGGGRFDAVSGRIAIDWHYAPGRSFSLTLTIPANTTAEVHLPMSPSQVLYEDGRRLASEGDTATSFATLLDPLDA